MEEKKKSREEELGHYDLFYVPVLRGGVRKVV